jgi:hypothetical protein
MEFTKPLKQHIAELQAMEDANPGILCTLEDHEWGAGVPKVEIALVYVNEHQHVIVLDDFKIKSAQGAFKQYTETTPEEMWESFGEDKGMWTSLEHYKKDHEMIRAAAEQDVKDFATAVPMVVLRT